jgi:hypothetical protein
MIVAGASHGPRSSMIDEETGMPALPRLLIRGELTLCAVAGSHGSFGSRGLCGFEQISFCCLRIQDLSVIP